MHDSLPKTFEEAIRLDAQRKEQRASLLNALIGKTEAEARALCTSHGLEVRVLVADVRGHVVRTLGSLPSRCNLRLENGRVVSADIG